MDAAALVPTPVGELSRRSGDLSTVVTAMRQMHSQQQEINRTTGNMNQLNLLLNCTNFARGKRLQLELAKGQAALKELGQHAHAQDEELGRVQSTLQLQGSELTTLETSVKAKQDEVGAALARMQDEMSLQQRLIAEQRLEIDRLRASKLRQDLVVDSGIVPLSGFAVNTPLVSWPLWAVTSALSVLPMGLRRSRKLVLGRLLRMLSFLAIARSMRVYAMRRGLHNYVGNAQEYSGYLWLTLLSAAKQRAAELGEGEVGPGQTGGGEGSETP